MFKNNYKKKGVLIYYELERILEYRIFVYQIKTFVKPNEVCKRKQVLLKIQNFHRLFTII